VRGVLEQKIYAPDVSIIHQDKGFCLQNLCCKMQCQILQNRMLKILLSTKNKKKYFDYAKFPLIDEC
jgi:hypothetical protein